MGKSLTKNEELAFIAGFQAGQANKFLWGSLDEYGQASVHTKDATTTKGCGMENLGSGEMAELHYETCGLVQHNRYPGN